MRFEQGYWLYPDGVIFWGGNGVHSGHFGIKVSERFRRLRPKIHRRIASRLHRKGQFRKHG